MAIRIGDWKLVRQHFKDKETPTLALYNLVTDPEENINMADKHPEIVKNAVEIFSHEQKNAEPERFRIPSVEKGLLGN